MFQDGDSLQMGVGIVSLEGSDQLEMGRKHSPVAWRWELSWGKVFAEKSRETKVTVL